LIGAAVAAGSVFFGAIFPHAGWIMTLPFVVGAATGILIGIFLPASDSDLPSIESEISEVEVGDEVSFHSDFYAALQKPKKPTIGQLDLFEQIVEDPSERRKIGRIITQKGQMFVVQCTRFQDLLVSRIVDDIDKATDHALAVAMRRHVKSVDPQRESLFRRSFRETVKSDFRGSVARLIARVGDKVINELRKEAASVEQEKGDFRLESTKTKGN
jgi:hypothetical protein